MGDAIGEAKLELGARRPYPVEPYYEVEIYPDGRDPHEEWWGDLRYVEPGVKTSFEIHEMGRRLPSREAVVQHARELARKHEAKRDVVRLELGAAQSPPRG